MDMMALIDQLEDIIANGRKVPFSGSVIIKEQKIYEIIDDLRAALPEELKQARWIVKERQEMIDEAEREANRIIEEGRRKAESMVMETEIVKQAEKKANEIIEEALAKEREVRLGAEDYADEMLANLEVNLGKLLTAVQRGRDRLQGRLERS
ncbi:MAG: ATPase [Actinomycetota bacterium]|nr:ATPase [Actinomycetota bacterium]